MSENTRLMNAIGDANTQHVETTRKVVRDFIDGGPNPFEDALVEALDEAQGAATSEDVDCYVIIRVRGAKL